MTLCQVGAAIMVTGCLYLFVDAHASLGAGIVMMAIGGVGLLESSWLERRAHSSHSS